MSLEPGTKVTERIQLVRKLAQGGMGSIWVADHVGLNRQVAVKFMSPTLTRNTEAMQRFTVEAQASACIRSPHVPQIFDVGQTEDGIPYIVMELLVGEDLHGRLTRAGTFTLEQAAMLVAQIGSALAKAHALGIVHRDIKPENIFITPAGRETRGSGFEGADGEGPFVARLLDFGIAKAGPDMDMESITRTGATMGTPSYMSPEQLLCAKSVDVRSDLWSLAVVAYFAITGKLPFEGETFGVVCVAIDRGEFALPSVLRPDLPPTVDAWFKRALARDASRRFASAREMSRALGGAVEGRASAWTLVKAVAAEANGESTLTGAANTKRELRGGDKKRPLVLASLALAASVAVVGAAFARPWASRHAEAPARAAAGGSVVSSPDPLASAEAPAPIATAPTATAIATPKASPRAPRHAAAQTGAGNPYDTAQPSASVGDADLERAHADHLSTLQAPAPPRPQPSGTLWNAKEDLGEIKEK